MDQMVLQAERGESDTKAGKNKSVTESVKKQIFMFLAHVNHTSGNGTSGKTY